MENDAITPFFSRRRSLFCAGLSLFIVSACEAKPMTVTLDVVLFSYLDRPIFDVFINGKAGDSSGVYPETGGSTISGVMIPLGPQRVTWTLGGPEGMVDNGKIVAAKNQPLIKDVPSMSRYLAIYIYPDSTVELLTSQYYPGTSARGEAEIKILRAKNGK